MSLNKISLLIGIILSVFSGQSFSKYKCNAEENSVKCSSEDGGFQVSIGSEGSSDPGWYKDDDWSKKGGAIQRVGVQSPFPPALNINPLHVAENSSVGSGFRNYNKELSRLYNTNADGDFDFCAIGWGCNFVKRAETLRKRFESRKSDTIKDQKRKYDKTRKDIDTDLASLKNNGGYSSDFAKKLVDKSDYQPYVVAKEMQSQASKAAKEEGELASNIARTLASIPEGKVSITDQDIDPVRSLKVPSNTDGFIPTNTLGYSNNAADNIGKFAKKAQIYSQAGYYDMAAKMNEVEGRLQTYVNTGKLPAVSLNNGARTILGDNANLDTTNFSGHETGQLANGFGVLPGSLKSREIELQFGILLDKLSGYAKSGGATELGYMLSGIEIGWSLVTTLSNDPMAKLGLSEGYALAKQGFEDGVYELVQNPLSVVDGLVAVITNHEAVWRAVKDGIRDNYDILSNCEDQPFACGEIAAAIRLEIELGVLTGGSAGLVTKAGRLGRYAVKNAAKTVKDKWSKVATIAKKLQLSPDEFEDVLEYGSWNIPPGSPFAPDALETAEAAMMYADDIGLKSADVIDVIKKLGDSARQIGVKTRSGFERVANVIKFKNNPNPDVVPMDIHMFPGSDDSIKKVAGYIQQAEGKFDVVIHGSQRAFHVLHNGKEVVLSHRDVAKYMKKNGWNGTTPVRLLSCSTGACDMGAAKNLANKLGVKVEAPTNTLFIFPDGRMVIGPNWRTNTGKWETFLPGR